MKVRIRYNTTEIQSVLPIADDAEILGSSGRLLITTPEQAKVMLEAAGIDTNLLEQYL